MMLVASASVACGGDDSSTTTESRDVATTTTSPETTAPRATSTTDAPRTTTAEGTSTTVQPADWVPDGWTTEDVVNLSELVHERLAEDGYTVDLDLDAGVGELSDGRQIGLVNLAQRAADLDVKDWSTEVDAYVTALLETVDDVTAMPYADVAAQLRIRVGEPDAIGVTSEQVLARPLVGDLLAVVVVDQPLSISYVPASAPDAWSVDGEEIYQLAVAQTLAQPVEPEVLDTGEVGVAGDIYAASWVLDPSRVVADAPPEGLVISIPNATLFLAVPVPSLDVEAIARLDILNRQDFAAESNPASDDMYWWHDGTLELIESRGDGMLQLPLGLDALIAD